MVKPSLSQLLEKEGVNRYALVVATAKCARAITDEYIREREYAEKLGIKDTDRSASVVNQKYRDERAVQNAIDELYNGEYSIVRSTLPEELREAKDKSSETDDEIQTCDRRADETASDGDESETTQSESEL